MIPNLKIVSTNWGAGNRQSQVFPSTRLQIQVAGIAYDSSVDEVLFSWKVLRNGFDDPTVFSVSKNPATMNVNPWTLMTGYTYSFLCTGSLVNGGSSSITTSYYVLHGYIHVAIAGGYKRLVAYGQPLILDGTESFDDYYGGQSVVSYMWSCFFTYHDVITTSCEDQLYARNQSIATVRSFAPGQSYQFNLTLTTPDGMTNTSSVKVSAVDCGSSSTAQSIVRTLLLSP